MACETVKFSAHGLIKLTIKAIDVEHVVEVIENGETIFEYPKDRPYPSRLMLGWISLGTSRRALHVVVAEDVEHSTCIVITAYWPDEQIWSGD